MNYLKEKFLDTKKGDKLEHWSERILSDEADKIRGKSQIKFEKAASFKEACEILDSLKAKGILDYEAEDPREHYSYHTIQVKFNYDENGDQIMNSNEIAEVLSKVDEILISEDSANEWQLGSRLYGMTD